MKLLLDLGNTRLKWAMSSSSADWAAQGAADWDEILVDGSLSVWNGLERPSMVVGASVVDASRESQVEAIMTRLFDRPITWLRTPATACGVHNAYAEPHRLGVDRFLAMVFAKAGGKAPCVLAGVGTALTLDALAADGHHLGGLIVPGPLLMQRSLLEATARVRPERAGQIVDAADNTADAVASGCWHAAAALIERFYARMQPRLDGSSKLLLAGGDAPPLLSLLSLPAELVHDGVLRGLAVWVDTQMAPSASD
jgi:type III pantothenate kinase